MARKELLRKLSFIRSGDTLETKLMDSSYKTYFKEKTDINNKQQMKKLVESLKSKGVNFPII